MAKRATVEPPAPFTGFPPDAFAFFRELEANNDRAWFAENKGRYEGAVKGPLGALVEGIAFGCAARELPLTGTAKAAVFRIHRDTRFSHDKRPYKTNAGAVLTRDGDKRSPGLLYLHVEAAGGFVAAGFYGPEPETLAALRTGIVERGADWRGVVAALEPAGLSLSDEGAAKRLPRGFDAAAVGTLERWVRLKSFTVSRRLEPAAMGSGTLVGTVVAFAQDALPLLRFGWRAIETGRGRAAAA